MEQFFEFVVNNSVLVGIWVALFGTFVFLEMSKGGKALTAQQVVHKMNKENAVILDVRDKADFKKGHIIDAINMPYSSLMTKVDKLDKYKKMPVVVVCKMGQSANGAGSILRKAGFEDVARLAGGMAEWSSLNFPVEA